MCKMFDKKKANNVGIENHEYGDIRQYEKHVIRLVTIGYTYRNADVIIMEELRPLWTFTNIHYGEEPGKVYGEEGEARKAWCPIKARGVDETQWRDIPTPRKFLITKEDQEIWNAKSIKKNKKLNASDLKAAQRKENRARKKAEAQERKEYKKAVKEKEKEIKKQMKQEKKK